MKKIGSIGLIVCMATAIVAPASAMAAGGDKTTKYRVYQYDKALVEFADYGKAEAYARWYSNSRVEEIGSGAWLWDNYPHYQVYQYDYSSPDWKFAKLEDAIREASMWSHATVRDLQGKGWVWNNYPRYRVYQGDITLDSWSFTDLNAAIAEAKRWSGSHIIYLEDNRWVWDNIPPKEKEELRSGPAAYQVYQRNYTQDSWRFASLEDAIQEALRWSNSTVIRLADKHTVYSNLKEYKVYQNETALDEFTGLDQAADYARLWANASIRLNGRIIWNNFPTYTVYQNQNRIGGFFNIPEALAYARLYSNASIRSLDGKPVWNNFRKLQFWAWNGASAKSAIMSQTASVMGLDVDSPSWFQLGDAEGTLKDTSAKETADWLKGQGFQVHPLVSNQFDKALTSEFLAKPEAQERFIKALVDRAAELQVQGINVDFESLNGSDRAAYTAFIEQLTAAAHEKQLKVSIDLPRGSVRWNHLTAFDHEKLGQTADYIITMAYDQHYAGSPSTGSVSGLPWAEEGIKEFLSYGIPRDKLILGIPFYTREWTLDANGGITDTRALYMSDTTALLASSNAVKTWDPAFLQYKVEYTATDGNRRVFWLENQDTAKARLELAKKYELAGVAAWRLGQELPDIWKTILPLK